MRSKATKKCLERRLARAYVLLLLVPPDEDGSRRILLGRYGHYDVRLVELARENPDGAAETLWMELYAHDRQAVIDSCGRDGIEDAAIAAEGLITQARQLNRSDRTRILQLATLQAGTLA
jgi:hypothetical protein